MQRLNFTLCYLRLFHLKEYYYGFNQRLNFYNIKKVLVNIGLHPLFLLGTWRLLSYRILLRRDSNPGSPIMLLCPCQTRLWQKKFADTLQIFACHFPTSTSSASHLTSSLKAQVPVPCAKGGLSLQRKATLLIAMKPEK